MSEELKAAQARIAELEGALSWHEEQRNDMAEIRAELAAIKAQEPVAYQHQGRDGEWYPFLTQVHYEVILKDGSRPIRQLYAAPVSEAKAQGVVMPAELDRAFITGVSCDGVYRVVIQSEKLKEMQAVHSWLTSLNGAPVQQVSVPASRDTLTLAYRLITSELKTLANGSAIDRYKAAQCELRAMIDAPAAPAADAWIPVSERLPGEDDQVLCWCEDETVAWAEVSSHHNSFFMDMTHELLPVTHWMPLPAAPAAHRAKGVV